MEEIVQSTVTAVMKALSLQCLMHHQPYPVSSRSGVAASPGKAIEICRKYFSASLQIFYESMLTEDGAREQQQTNYQRTWNAWGEGGHVADL